MAAAQDGELILLDPSSGSYWGLNSTGAEIWALLDQLSSPSEIVQHLSQRVDIEPSSLHIVVESYLAELGKQGLVSRSPE
jgi:hypothetical protein